MLAIDAVGLTKTYRGAFGLGRGQAALRGVDLAVPRGIAFGLIGPNGAGKTTFIKALLGVVTPTSGTVRVLGGSPDDREIRARIGYLPERLQPSTALTGIGFLESVARMKRLVRPRAEAQLVVGRVGLAGEEGRRVGGYSKGMRQRLGLAAALLGAPDLLILDEPTDGIDPLGRVEVRNLLAQELRRGATIFLNSHLLSETERICQRIGILSGGTLRREGRLDELTRAPAGWLVRFDGAVSDVTLSAAGFTPSESGAWRCDAEDAAGLNAAIDRARASGALVVEVIRDSRTLEAVLAETLGQAA